MRIVDRDWLKAVVREDLRAHDVDRWRFRYRLTHPEIAFQVALRRVESIRPGSGIFGKVLLAFAKVRLHRWSLITGLQVPPGVAGPGLCLPHFGSVVVNAQARIGQGCRIHASTTIGADLRGFPTLGDNVYVGPGAVIYGPVKVGDGAVIGANSVVNRDVDRYTTVAGAPARVIARSGSEELIRYRGGRPI